LRCLASPIWQWYLLKQYSQPPEWGWLQFGVIQNLVILSLC